LFQVVIRNLKEVEMMISEIAKRLEKLAKEGRISSEEMKKFKEQEILVEQSFRFLRGC
jgi:hypothetical protein